MTSFLDLVTGSIAFIITLMILSYLIGDNPLFRLANYLFIGVSAGYVAAIAWHQVLWPKLVLPLMQGSLAEHAMLFVPLVLGIMLLGKLTPRLSGLGRPVMALLVGSGAAVAIGGIILGTLIPQVETTLTLPALPGALFDTMARESLMDGIVILIGTVVTLLYFQFGVNPRHAGKRNRFMQAIAYLGQAFIAITFGVLFAGVYAAALSALIERTYFLFNFVISFLG